MPNQNGKIILRRKVLMKIVTMVLEEVIVLRIKLHLKMILIKRSVNKLNLLGIMILMNSAILKI